MEQFAARTHPGLRRTHNEDAYAASPELGLWLVADGVGGHAFGEVASDIVQSSLVDSVTAGKPLLDAVHQAHQAVLEEMSRREENLGMGSTVVVFYLRDNHYQIAWVGDSRAYFWNGNTLTQLTQDHTHVASLVQSGALSADEAVDHPERHVLTQSIGVFENMVLNPGFLEGQWSGQEQVLLCSDGLTDELTDGAIAELLRTHGSLESQADSLLNASLASGGRDNITLLIVGKADTSGESQPAVDMDTTQEFQRDAVRRAISRINYMAGLCLVIIVIIAAVLISLL